MRSAPPVDPRQGAWYTATCSRAHPQACGTAPCSQKVATLHNSDYVTVRPIAHPHLPIAAIIGRIAPPVRCSAPLYTFRKCVRRHNPATNTRFERPEGPFSGSDCERSAPGIAYDNGNYQSNPPATSPHRKVPQNAPIRPQYCPRRHAETRSQAVLSARPSRRTCSPAACAPRDPGPAQAKGSTEPFATQCSARSWACSGNGFYRSHCRTTLRGHDRA